MRLVEYFAVADRHGVERELAEPTRECNLNIPREARQLGVMYGVAGGHCSTCASRERPCCSGKIRSPVLVLEIILSTRMT
jgi:hypothetical protein